LRRFPRFLYHTPGRPARPPGFAFRPAKALFLLVLHVRASGERGKRGAAGTSSRNGRRETPQSRLPFRVGRPPACPIGGAGLLPALGMGAHEKETRSAGWRRAVRPATGRAGARASSTLLAPGPPPGQPRAAADRLPPRAVPRLLDFSRCETNRALAQGDGEYSRFRAEGARGGTPLFTSGRDGAGGAGPDSRWRKGRSSASAGASFTGVSTKSPAYLTRGGASGSETWSGPSCREGPASRPGRPPFPRPTARGIAGPHPADHR